MIGPSAAVGQDEGGFTLVEMLVVCAMLSILAMAMLPMAEIAQQRWRERELRAALHEIRAAIDAYKRLDDRQREQSRVGPTTADSGYPPSLLALVQGWIPPSDAQQVLPQPLLRRLPRDPFAPDGVPAEQTWGLRSFASPAHAPRPGNDVYDVYSLSDRVGSNGIALKLW